MMIDMTNTSSPDVFEMRGRRFTRIAVLHASELAYFRASSDQTEYFVPLCELIGELVKMPGCRAIEHRLFTTMALVNNTKKQDVRFADGIGEDVLVPLSTVIDALALIPDKIRKRGPEA